jgi:hypothetical protein
MAKVEIEETDLAAYQHVKGVADAIMANPSTRSGFLRLAKTANPKLAIPEVDAAAPVMEAVAGVNKKLDEFIAAQQEQARKDAEAAAVRVMQSTWRDAESQLLQRGWLKAGVEEVKKFAEANGISDLTIAADAFERRNPQPMPAASASSWNLFQRPEAEDTFVKDMMNGRGENESRLDQEIQQTLADVRSAQ